MCVAALIAAVKHTVEPTYIMHMNFLASSCWSIFRVKQKRIELASRDKNSQFIESWFHCTSSKYNHTIKNLILLSYYDMYYCDKILYDIESLHCE